MAKYVISAIDSPIGETVGSAYEYDPENAIIQWCRYSEKYPTCASIQPESKDAGTSLLKWAKLNFEKVEVYMREHKCPYRIDWMKEQIESQVRNGKNSMQWEYDQLFPFCMG